MQFYKHNMETVDIIDDFYFIEPFCGNYNNITFLHKSCFEQRE